MAVCLDWTHAELLGYAAHLPIVCFSRFDLLGIMLHSELAVGWCVSTSAVAWCQAKSTPSFQMLVRRRGMVMPRTS